MNLDITRKDKTLIASVKGELNSANSPVVLDKLMEEITSDTPEKLIFDMSETPYTTSAGIRVINNLDLEMENRGGSFLLYGIKDVVEEVLNLTGILSVIKTIDSLD